MLVLRHLRGWLGLHWDTPPHILDYELLLLYSVSGKPHLMCNLDAVEREVRIFRKSIYLLHVFQYTVKWFEAQAINR